MKLEMWEYNRLLEITGGTYKASKSADEDSAMLYDGKDAISDLITEYDVVEEKYSDLKEKIQRKIDELEEHKFMIDMIDNWSDGDKNAWNKCVYQVKLLKEMLGD